MQRVWNLKFTFIGPVRFTLQKNVCYNSDIGKIRKWSFFWFSLLFFIKKCFYIGDGAYTQQRPFYTLSAYFPYINV